MKIQKVNWAQATVEVLLLLGGAGLALGLDAWNDERLERRAEAEYLFSLTRDFQETRENFQWAINGNARVRDDNRALLELVSGPPGSVPLDSLSRRSIRNFWLYEFEPVLGTYFDLLNSGKLEILRDDSLRYALTQFESQLVRIEMEAEVAADFWSQSLVPFLLRQTSASEFMERSYLGAELPPSRFPLNEATFWSRDYANLLTMTVVSRQQLVRMGENQLEEAESVLRLLQKAQEGS
jgi:hypothetical protein